MSSKNPIMLLLLTLMMVLGYQNCGKVVFKSDEANKAEGQLGDPIIDDITDGDPDAGDGGGDAGDGDGSGNGDNPDDGDSGDDDGDSDDDDSDDDSDGDDDDNSDSDEDTLAKYCDKRPMRAFWRKNLIRNGGFEKRDSRIGLKHRTPLNELGKSNKAKWDFYDSLPGRRVNSIDSWVATDRPLEVQSGIVIDSFRGNRHVELDSDGNTSIYQDVVVCHSNLNYVLSFAYASRTQNSSSAMKVMLGDQEIAALDGNSNKEWKVYRYRISNLSRGVHRLSFHAKGASDSVGALVDRVRLKKEFPRVQNVVTILLALGDQNEKNLVIERKYAKRIARNAVRIASGKLRPKVLLVKDAAHNGESKGDAEYIANELLHRFKVDLIEEPEGGLTMKDTHGYDVIWLNNPGHPIGSLNTKLTLMEYKGGVVVSGDDASRGRNFSMTSLTGLKYKSNGTSVRCGNNTYPIDNNRGNRYSVGMKKYHPGVSPLEEDVAKYLFEYGNDIDHTEVVNSNAVVIATAGVQKPGCNLNIPVIVTVPKADISIDLGDTM